jgi:uncharacterized SAM-binding protein YcdF (DUF218 family)
MARRALLVARVVTVVLLLATMLPGIAGRFLVLDEPLDQADAIVVLGGDTPQREIEAARLYRDGWAPRVILVHAQVDHQEEATLKRIGINRPPVWERRYRTLLDEGVPDDAIDRQEAWARDTLDELEVVASVLPDGASAILVSSSQHTRRVRIYWDYVNHGQRVGRAHPTLGDGFDPEYWWQDVRARRAVLTEYAGIGNWALGFPIRRPA